MAAIWTRRIIAGTQSFAKCPARFKEEVLAGLKAAVAEDKLSAHEFQLITGEEYTA